MTPRKRRTEPGDAMSYQEDVLDPVPLDIERAEKDKLDMFAYLASLSEVECNRRWLYIYRLEPTIRNPEGTGSYIEKVKPPVDEDYIVEKHGGGKYLLWLKFDKDNGGDTDRKSTFSAAGTAKIASGTMVIDAATGAPVQPQTQPAAAPAANGEVAVMREIVQVLREQIQNKPKASEEDLLESGLGVMRKAMGNAMEIIAESAKSKASSMTGNEVLDSLLKQQLASLAQPRDQMEQFKTMLQTIKEMQQLTGPAQQSTRHSSVLGELKDIAELLKSDDEAGTLRSLLLRGRDRDEEESESGFGSFFKFATKALEQNPNIIGDIASGIKAAFNSRPEVAHRAAPALGSVPAQPSQQQPQQPSAPPVEPKLQPPPPSAAKQAPTMLDLILESIVNGFRNDMMPDDIAFSLKVLYPQAIPRLREMLGYSDDQILGWLKTQPVIAPILNEAEFPKFFEEFKSAVLDDETEGGEEEGDAAHAGESKPEPVQ